jgi:hypothetical protein
MIKGFDNIVSWLRAVNEPYWKIYPHGNGKNNYIFESGDEPSLSIETSIDRFMDRLKMLEPGRYVIVAKAENKPSKGFAEIVYLHEKAGQENNSIGALPAQSLGISEEECEKRIDAALKRHEERKRFEELEKENQRLQQELKIAQKPDYINEAIGKIAPYIDPFLSQFTKSKGISTAASIAVSGFQKNEVTDDNMSNTPFIFTPPANDTEASDRATKTVQEWTADPRFLEIIEKINHIRKTDPGKYTMFSGMLLG